MKSVKNKKGVTLIELIVVIAILAILAGITVPSVLNRIEIQRDVGRKTDTEQIYRLSLSAATDLARNGQPVTVAGILDAISLQINRSLTVLNKDAGEAINPDNETNIVFYSNASNIYIACYKKGQTDTDTPLYSYKFRKPVF